MRPSHKIDPVFDDSSLVSQAGLVPMLQLAESAGFYDLLAEQLTVPSAAPVAKTAAVVAGMLAGADSIEDLDVLRHGAMGRLFAGVRAPTTLGTFLRSFTHGHVRQLDAVNTRFLVGLAHQHPGLIAGSGAGDDGAGIAFVDIDDTIREVHGHAKQGAGFGYSGVRGLNIQLAALSTPLTAPVVTGGRLRKGNTASGNGAAGLLANAVTTARAMGVTGQVMARADSAYFRHDFIKTAIAKKIWFSVTARMNPAVKRAVTSIDEQAWKAIKYPQSIWENDESHLEGGYWVSDAHVAEISFVAFTSRRKRDHVRCRLAIRRVARHQPLASDGTVQGELFATYRYHAFITNSDLSLVEADERHRDHAIIEQVIAELKDNALAHLPSGKYAANAAWVACAITALNLTRAAALAATMPKARWRTIRDKLITVPGRVATRARRLLLHMPTDWPWAPAWHLLHHAITAATPATGPPNPLTN